MLLPDCETVAAVQEEWFSRKKHDSRFPINAIRYCFQSQNIESIVYYEKQLLTFERLLETYLGLTPRGGNSIIATMAV